MLAVSPTSPWTQSQLIAAVQEAMEAYGDVLYPFGEQSPLTEAERDVLQRGGADLVEHPPGGGDALLRSTAEFTAIWTTALTTAEAARRLGVSDMRVRQRLAAGSLLGVQSPRGWRLSSFQFVADGEIPGWDKVARALPADVSPVEVLTWLELPHPDLVLRGHHASPRAWLIGGHPVDAVVRAADDFVNR